MVPETSERPHPMSPVQIPVLDEAATKRFEKWFRVDESGCWLWLGHPQPNGYGNISIYDQVYKAHRVSYRLYKGPIPDGLTIDHLCRVTLCVNPDHLEAVTMRENVLRGRSFIVDQVRQTHCIHGHLLDGRRANNSRYCLTCNRARNNERKRKEIEARTVTK